MLVLSRQRDQAIMIGEDIEVSVVDIRGDKVRLGINAPRSVSVHRKEIYDAIRKENKAAAEIRPGDLGSLLAPPAPQMKIADDGSHGDPFLRAAIDEAKKSLSHGGIPTGAVLVRDSRIIGRGHNRRIQRGDPMAHAEIDCLTNAGRQKTYRDTVLYTTTMPCLLCAGAVMQFGIPRVIVADCSIFAGAECRNINSKQLLANCGVEVVDLQDAAARQLLADYIQANPGLWSEDLGRP